MPRATRSVSQVASSNGTISAVDQKVAASSVDGGPARRVKFCAAKPDCGRCEATRSRGKALRNGQETLTIERMPADDLPETFHVTTAEQLRAVANLTRHRIMAVLRFEPATITQIADRVGLAKGSSSYHVRLLERAGLVTVVRTRKVRGVTERYYAMAAQSIELPDPGEGRPDVLMRNAVADLEAAPADGTRQVRMAHLRLTEEQFTQLGERLQALADEYRDLSDPSLPDASLVFALFHPATRVQAGGDAE